MEKAGLEYEAGTAEIYQPGNVPNFIENAEDYIAVSSAGASDLSALAVLPWEITPWDPHLADLLFLDKIIIWNMYALMTDAVIYPPEVEDSIEC